MPPETHREPSSTAAPTAAPTDLEPAWRQALGRHPATSRGRHGQCLGFLLELVRNENPQAPARLEAAPVLLGGAQHDATGKAFPLDIALLAQSTLTLAEQKLATSVLGQPLQSRKGRQYLTLQGALGDSLLIDMLDTTPCYLGGLAGLHLARGRTHALHWNWLREDSGLQRLRPRLARGQQLLRLGKLWYLDVQNTTLGLLHSEEDEAWLLDLPALDPTHSAELATRLAKSPLASRIPVPHVFQPPREIHEAPQAALRLHVLQGHASLPRETILAYACPAFEYAGARIPAGSVEAVVTHVQAGNQLEIHRQRALELAALERLEQLGLFPAVDTEGLPWEVTRALPEQAWLFPGTGHAGALEVNTPARWMALRERLHEQGFQLEYAEDFPYEVVEAPVQWYVRANDKSHHRRFELEVGVELGGESFNLLPAISRALDSGQLDWEQANDNDSLWYAPLDQRRRLPVPVRECMRILAPLRDLLQRPLEQVRLPKVQAGRLDELAGTLPADARLQAPRALREFTSRLRNAAGHAHGKAPKELKATLRGYQHEGLRWLNALAEAGIGGILADDMGLGKTLQVLAHLLLMKQSGQLEHPALVVAPTSLIPNWESEATRFAPSLPLLALSGPNRGEHFHAIDRHAIVLTSYALLPRDLAQLKKHHFALIVLDEAQQVKNPRTRARRAVLALKAPRRLCLTGTPLENHLGELWSQIDLAVPGLLGDEKSFQRHYRGPIEKGRDEDCQQRLNQRLAPFILRRTKNQVATELPPKTEVTRRVRMESRQRGLYDQLRENLSEQLRDSIRERGIEHSGIIVLDALLKLRQVCCDPRLVKHEAAHGVHESAKFELLMDILPALLAEGRRVLLFSQFTEMLKLIAAELERRHIDFVTLTGETRDRAEPVRRFQDGEVPLFLLSLKAGGVGLNLTAADAVIHYDPWWNPAAEAQASDRAHRIGQDKPVLVYRLITAGTVEERIEAMKARKAELAQAVLEGGGSRTSLTFDQADLDALLAPA